MTRVNVRSLAKRINSTFIYSERRNITDGIVTYDSFRWVKGNIAKLDAEPLIFLFCITEGLDHMGSGYSEWPFASIKKKNRTTVDNEVPRNICGTMPENPSGAVVCHLGELVGVAQ